MAKVKRFAASGGGRSKGTTYPKPVNNPRLRMPAEVATQVRLRQQQERQACDAEEALFKARSLTPAECAKRDEARARIARQLGIHADLLDIQAVLGARQLRTKKQLGLSGKRSSRTRR